MEHSTGALLFFALCSLNLTRWLVKRSQVRTWDCSARDSSAARARTGRQPVICRA
jgi:hypothetical protein